MADIEIKCSKCGTVVTVSQFVDRNVLKCNSCGEKFAPDPARTPEQRHTARLLKVQDTSTREKEIKKVEENPTEWRFLKHTEKMRQDNPEAPNRATSVIVAWIVFVVLGVISGGLRYGKILSPKDLELFATIAPVIVISFHIAITLMAFKHSVFHGVLCLLIPGYSLYFIFVASDDFILRAIVGGILVGTGEDSWVFLRQYSLDIYNFVTRWISLGGSSK